MGARRRFFEFLRLACLVAAAPLAKAGPDDAALLQQVKQLASKGQDPQTTAQVDQYVDANQDAITAILKQYADYLKQLQALSADGEIPTAPASPASQPSSSSPSSQPAAAQAAANGQTAALQPSSGLQITGVQASGALQTAHLAGYPALPAVDPISSVTRPTAEQAAYAAKVKKELEARKQYLEAHPEGYTY